MKRTDLLLCSGLLLASCVLSACAGTGPLISSPGVSLRDVRMTEIDFSGQTFLLGFAVTNPNPFPLPVEAVSYAVDLDGYRFATGQTEGGFTVPARGDSEFAISVELNLLKTAPQLLYVVREGVKRDIPYKLKGKLGVDIPLVQAVAFEAAGELRLQSSRD
ncbi:MAG: LEA type 2 family protein [Gammaproteobacteria bacterium]|nr:LEA type 2 family protein [Gammaproteobacteria bacterium]MDH3372339.1 LEA type 2 family protein [Gammaproteobacteria bacterium]MDH3409045.1 LEA type 2 family protein [Gammaproteobacteria bacterium]MDH3552096.1 LEA type 2 family protein [Gammaproteobacteria bacterium]